ncbi:hypothetical protein [Streptomyces sp. NBC_01268]|uniref:hypothetical protein n=1 Tax=Streptomyces sp. NBC_01268 TaxID=2903806 RepID=UPI002E34C71E|nr:hypothetical protein [Streptomyces sp. NBC_01268]
MTTPSPADRLRLAKLVIQRRRELGWHKVDAAKAAELTHTTYMRVEKGEPVRDVTYVKIEAAFGWAPGACAAILEGADEAQLAGEVVDGVRLAPVAGMDEKARKAVQDAVIAVLPDTPAGDMVKLSEKVVEFLRGRGIVPPE